MLLLFRSQIQRENNPSPFEGEGMLRRGGGYKITLFPVKNHQRFGVRRVGVEVKAGAADYTVFLQQQFRVAALRNRVA